MTTCWMLSLAAVLLLGAIFFFRRARADLHRAREHDSIMSLAVEQSPMAVAITDAEGNLIYGNPAFCRRTGYTLLDLIGQNPRLLKSGLMEEELYEELWSTILDGRIWEGELCNKTKDGDLYWEHANIGSIRDGSGAITNFVKVAEDITEKKKLRQAQESIERRFQAVFQQASLGMAMVDMEGRWKEVNDSLCRMVGYQASELLGRHFLEITPEEDRQLEDDWKSRLEGAPTPGRVLEKRYRHRDGHTVWVEVSACVVRDEYGQPDFVLTVITDITRRREAEEDAARDREELAHVLRIHTLQQMTSELSHEIDQPLCAILSAAQAAVRLHRNGAGSSAELNEALKVVIGQTERAGEVVRRIKDFSRKRESNLQPVDLFSILSEAGALLEPEVRRLKTRLSLETAIVGDCPVLAERIQIQQVVMNLCRNAAEAMQAAGSPDPAIVIGVERDEQWVHVRVRDCGPAIERELREAIFTPFFTTRDHGLGLGLALSRSIIDAHGGELVLDEGAGPGNSFHFTLPRHA